MTAFHFKGERLGTTGQRLRYRFYPDHVMAPDVTGEFEVDVTDWSYRIVSAAHAEERGLVSKDEHCVQALISKLEKVPGEAPELVFFIA
jgi:hypothetical protein